MGRRTAWEIAENSSLRDFLIGGQNFKKIAFSSIEEG